MREGEEQERKREIYICKIREREREREKREERKVCAGNDSWVQVGCGGVREKDIHVGPGMKEKRNRGTFRRRAKQLS